MDYKQSPSTIGLRDENTRQSGSRELEGSRDSGYASIESDPIDSDDAGHHYVQSGDNNSEQYRLATFQSCPMALKSLVPKLAESGFYYTGHNKNTTCICCGIKIDNWTTSSNPSDPRHHLAGCGMVNATYPYNIPIEHRFRIADFAGVVQSVVKDSVRQFHTNFKLASIKNEHHKHYLKTIDLRQESTRLQTFATWPSNAPRNFPRILAKAGFFYLGDLDRVQCYSCRGVMRNWSDGDNVESEHRKYFPHCRISCNLSQSATRDQSTASTLNLPNAETTEILKRMYPCRNANNPHMMEAEKRKETFDPRWTANHIIATTSQIANAGFFYLGDKDRTKCWYCSGGLQNWERNDEPWLEHAKWFPGCEYVLQTFGPEIIKNLIDKYPNLPRPTISNNVDYKVGLDMMKRLTNRGTILDAFLKSEIVANAITMGFPKEQIETLAQRKWEKDGHVWQTIDSLLEELLTTSTTTADEDMDTSAASMNCSMQERRVSFRTCVPMTVVKVVCADSTLEDLCAGQDVDTRLLEERTLCRKCEMNPADILNIPCRHLSICESCSSESNNVPKICITCEKPVVEATKVYLS